MFMVLAEVMGWEDYVRVTVLGGYVRVVGCGGSAEMETMRYATEMRPSKRLY